MPIVPDFLPTVKNTQKPGGIIPLFHAGSGEPLKFHYCEESVKIMRKLTEEWARGIQSRIPMGSFGKRKFWPMSSWRSPRENEGLNIIIDSGEVGCRRMCPRYLNLESEMRSEDGTICWRNDSVEVRALDSKDLPEYFVVQAADPSNLSWRINLRFRSLEENCLYNL